jgi:hypothetical protein
MEELQSTASEMESMAKEQNSDYDYKEKFQKIKSVTNSIEIK